MSSIGLVFAYLRNRPLATLMNVLLLALGVATIAVLLLFAAQAEQKLRRDSRAIDLVVGAKGSPMQLVLSSIYHLDVPTGNIPLAQADLIKADPMVKRAIPLALGDSYRGFRIVGTTTAFADLYGAKFFAGQMWKSPLEAVLGAQAARDTGLKPGASFVGSHGMTRGGQAHDDAPYKVVGILTSTGTVADRLIFTSVESIWKTHEEHEGKEITALLIQYSTPLAAISMPRKVNSQSALQAASPAYETARLLSMLGIGIDALRAFALVLILSAGLGVFIALSSALEERRHDLALLRILGASPGRLFRLVILEGVTLTAAGVILGLLLGHLGAELIGHWLADTRQIVFSGWVWVAEEGWLALGAVVLGCVAAVIPALRAYRHDIAPTLSQR